MKNMIMVAALLISSSAFAKDVSLDFCDAQKNKLSFTVIGTEALVQRPDGLVLEAKVTDTQEVAGANLENEAKLVGEELLSADTYVIVDKDGEMVTAVLNGKSGNKYFGALMMDGLNVFGSTNACK